MKWPARRLQSQAGKGYGMFETAARLQATGVDSIHLEVGRPSADTPLHIKEAAKTALDNGVVHYGELNGLGPLREALARRFREAHGVAFDGRRHVSFAALPGMRERTITVNAFTLRRQRRGASARLLRLRTHAAD